LRPGLPIERAGFPVTVSRLAEYESWRRERHRPATYTHKWWARRLGTVVQACLLGCVENASGSQPLAGLVVLDPFAGSGTTLVEARKLGARVIGRDINPVATLTQRQALQKWDEAKIASLHNAVAEQCQADIDALYLTKAGERVLQYFWVASSKCLTCHESVDLFSTRIFAKHAYPGRFPRAQTLCPHCDAVVEVKASTKRAACSRCSKRFSTKGPVSSRTFACTAGHSSNLIASLANTPPPRRLYAKLILRHDGTRAYEAIDNFDRDLYDRASKLLANSNPGELILPVGQLDEGVNTRQAVNWGYQSWSAFFNDRQLYTLGRIAAALSQLEACAEREALIASFGRTLEHHNLFCSYKGEGTGPVRSIFHNHTLRPERCNVEGNPWGTNGGSGGFAETPQRLGKSLEYKRNPTDLAPGALLPTAVAAGRAPLETSLVHSWKAFTRSSRSAYIATGDAATSDLPDESVDLICTDPPYLDNVHYSELADFFDAWMSQLRPFGQYPTGGGTRNPRELQNSDPEVFERMATRAWNECFRVLKQDGALVFSYHQSQPAGWSALMRSLDSAGFVVSATRPVIAEVSSSLTKGAAIRPNRIDVIVVARKRGALEHTTSVEDCIAELYELHKELGLGEGDVLSAIRAAVFAEGTRSKTDWDGLASRAELEATKACRTVLKWEKRVPAE
jgi:putative DNA methylase